MWSCRDLFDVPLVCVCVFEHVHAPSCTHFCPRAVALLLLWCVIYHLIDWTLCIRAVLFKRSSHGRGVSGRYCFNKTVGSREGKRSWLVTQAEVGLCAIAPVFFSVLNENAGIEGVSLKCLVSIMTDIEISENLCLSDILKMHRLCLMYLKSSWVVFSFSSYSRFICREISKAIHRQISSKNKHCLCGAFKT